MCCNFLRKKLGRLFGAIWKKIVLSFSSIFWANFGYILSNTVDHNRNVSYNNKLLITNPQMSVNS